MKENKSAAEKTEKAVSETKLSMLEVSEDQSFLDTCLREACQSIQRCLALLSDTTEEVSSHLREREGVTVSCRWSRRLAGRTC